MRAVADATPDNKELQMGTTSWDGVIRTVVDGLWFAEGPRWHDGALWCSDIHGHRVVRV